MPKIDNLVTVVAARYEVNAAKYILGKFASTDPEDIYRAKTACELIERIDRHTPRD